MKTTTVTDAKNRLSALIDQVRAGETITILGRGTPVARLEPVVSSADQTGRFARLTRAGIIRPADGRDLRAALGAAPAAPTPRESVVAALLDERRAGR